MVIDPQRIFVADMQRDLENYAGRDKDDSISSVRGAVLEYNWDECENATPTVATHNGDAI